MSSRGAKKEATPTKQPEVKTVETEEKKDEEKVNGNSSTDSAVENNNHKENNIVETLVENVKNSLNLEKNGDEGETQKP